MGYISDKKRMTVGRIVKKKASSEKIVVLTAYDWFMAKVLDRCGIDIILVGDSASNVVHGHDSTLPITMDVMVAHTAAVSRGNESALVVGDMPFLSFQPSTETAILNAGRFLKEGGAHAVKLEGGTEMAPTIKRLVEVGIPVMGHIGLTPQSIHRFGGPKIQGRKKKSQTYLKESALALEDAGCFSMVLELVETDTAREITESLKTAATIGIGAGVHCDGQVLVINDILGLGEGEFKPKFVRQYADLSPIISDAVTRFIADVRTGNYPGDEESYGGK